MQQPVAPYSLRRRLLVWLLVALAFIGVVALAETYRSARELADRVSDRVLAGSAQAIGERVVVGDDGNLEVDIPYVALDMLTSAAQDRVFYRIDKLPGDFITGYQGLPVPDEVDARPGIAFRDAVFRDEPIRTAVLNAAASSGLTSIPFRVTVAETTNARQRLSEDILLGSAARLGLLIVSAGLIVWLAVTAGLRPLQRLEEAIGRRSPDDLHPIAQRVPREVVGLVATINGFMARLAAALAGLRHFTGNASHQLRTPLAVVRTELALSMRAETLDAAREAGRNADRAVAHAERVLSQLLVLARVDEAASDRLVPATTDLAALARRLVSEYVRRAASADVDLGVEANERVEVQGDEILFAEMMRNLIENAIHYAGRGSTTTVRVSRRDGEAVLEVEDNGPGVPPEIHDKLGVRFTRGSPGKLDGAGLGLSIVSEIAALFGGAFTAANGPDGRGLTARVVLPAAAVA